MVILARKCQRDSSGLETPPGARKSVVTWISQDWGDKIQALFWPDSQGLSGGGPRVDGVG